MVIPGHASPAAPPDPALALIAGTDSAHTKWQGPTGTPAESLFTPVWDPLNRALDPLPDAKKAKLAQAMADHAAQMAQIWAKLGGAKPDEGDPFKTAEQAFLRVIGGAEWGEIQRRILRAILEICDTLDPAMLDAVRLGLRTASPANTPWPGPLRTPIARSPSDVIWQHGRYRVHRYHGRRDSAAPPILICYGMIGRHTVADLLPDRSLVARLLEQGQDVSIIDWGTPDGTGDPDGPSLAELSLDVLGMAVDAVCRKTERPSVVLTGICQGGTFTAIHAALRPQRIAGLILSGTPIDFHADRDDPNPAHGILNRWVRALAPNDIERLIALTQGIPGALLGTVFHQLNPVRTLRKYCIEMPRLLSDPATAEPFRAMETWLADRPDLPPRLAREWLIDLYHRNALGTGALRVNDDTVLLRSIAAPVLILTGTQDHIIPPPSQTALTRFLPDEQVTVREIASGHIGVLVGKATGRIAANEIRGWVERSVSNTSTRR